MIIDSSVVIAVFFQEPGYQSLLDQMSNSENVSIGAPTLSETGIVLSSRMDLDARPLLNRFLEELKMDVIPFTSTHFQLAIEAWLKFGKGRHPAGLNFGDCLAYAIASATQRPLLFVGNDFNQTDVEIAG